MCVHKWFSLTVALLVSGCATQPIEQAGSSLLSAAREFEELRTQKDIALARAGMYHICLGMNTAAVLKTFDSPTSSASRAMLCSFYIGKYVNQAHFQVPQFSLDPKNDEASESTKDPPKDSTL